MSNFFKKFWILAILCGMIFSQSIFLTAKVTEAAVPVVIVRDSPEYIQKELGGLGGLASRGIGSAISSFLPGEISTSLGGSGGGLVGGLLGSLTSDSAAYSLAQLMLRSLSQSIVNWIRTGGTRGGSLFVEDFGEFFKREADNAAGLFLEQYLDPRFFNTLCSPFRIQLGVLLNTSMLKRTFNQRARCTITDIVRNVESFSVDFTVGGWAGWESLLEPQNNLIGSLLLALDEKDRILAENFMKNSYDVITGGGFLSFKDCSNDPVYKVNCQTVTPGSLVAGAMKDVISDDRIRLQLADEMDEIVAAGIDRLMSWAITGGGGSKGLKNFDINSFNRTNETTRQARDFVFDRLQTALSLETRFLTAKESSLDIASTTVVALKQLQTCGNSGAGARIIEIENLKPRLALDILSANAILKEIEVRIADVSKANTITKLDQLSSQIDSTVSKIHNPAQAENELLLMQDKESDAERDLSICQFSSQ
ncbi:hypothetical protein HYW53_01255 [Candidatus Giovannonibacteria bacterium]|nr:hypothetical protein [Candidatus Giovannonibacteria bacterium]